MSDDYVPIAKLVRRMLGKPDKPTERCVCGHHSDTHGLEQDGLWRCYKCHIDCPAPVADGGECNFCDQHAEIAALRARADAAERALFQMQEAAKAQTTRADRLAAALREMPRAAAMFTMKPDRSIHPDIKWDDMNEAAKTVAHTTAQQIAIALQDIAAAALAEIEKP